MPVPNTFVAGTDILAADMNENFDNVEMIELTADEDLTAGQTVGLSNYLPSASVGRALRKHATATLGFTAVETLIWRHRYCPIGGDKFVFGLTQTSDDSLYLTVGSINRATKALTLGTAVAATADISGSLYALCKLGTDKFIVFYVEDASTTIVKYRIGTVSGTTITFGTAATFFTGSSAVQQLSCDFLETDKAVAVFKCTTTTHSRAVCMTASGTTATPGTAVALEASGINANVSTLVSKVATDKFVVITANGGSSRIHCASISGTTITFDAGGSNVYSANSTDSFDQFDVINPATDVIVFCYRNNSTSGTDVIAATISGTVISLGTTLASFTDGSGPNRLYAESSTSILMSNGSATFDAMLKMTRSGTTLTSVGIVIKKMMDGPQCIVTMDNGYFVALASSNGANGFKAFIQGMSNNFFGIAQASVSRGAAVKVQYSGKDEHQTNLIPGRLYQADGTGGLSAINSEDTVDSPIEKFVTAISATAVIL